MKKIIAFAVTALLLGPNPALVLAVENATVQSVRVSADSVYIATDKPVEYKAFTMENPPKLVLELMDAKMKTLQEIPVNGAALRRVRTGQFKTSPVSISRIVLDLTTKTVYQITRKGTELVVMLGARPAAPAIPAVKDTPADTPAGVTVIVPEGAASKPVEMTLEAAPIKPANLNRESSPVPVVRKTRPSSSSSRNIMDTLSHEPITIDYSEAEVREVLDMLAAKAGINIIYGDDVTGTVTISLSKVPFDEVFKTLLNVKGLAAQQAGDNILRIAAPAMFMAEQKKALPQTRVFFLNYSKAADIKLQVDSVAAAEGRTAKCTNDDNNNALIVTDTALGLEATERLIHSLDRVPQQVLIEAKLVEVTLEDEMDYGISWSEYGHSNGTYTGAGTTVAGAQALGGKYIPNSAMVAVGAGGTGVSLPSDKTFGAFRLGKIASNYMIDATITAAAKKGKAKVLSDPKVATLNNKEANINITDQTPYNQQTVTVGVSGPTTSDSWQNITTGITLKVTPTINSDGRITMHVIPSVIQLSGTPTGNGPPATATRNTDTNVIVKNGETIVIGGLIHDSESNYVYKVPLLGDIPLLGYLFKKKSVSRSRVELLIFVTPKIIED